MADYGVDRFGFTVRNGDYIQFLEPHVTLSRVVINEGSRRRVQDMANGFVEVYVDSKHPDDPYLTTLVPINRVKLCGRQSPGFRKNPKRHLEKEAPMLYLAVLLPNQDAVGYQVIADEINNTYVNNGSDSFGLKTIADTSQSALKEKVRQDIANNPDHRWLMLSGNILARAEHPPVRFSQW
jgi:hypothetical protein